MRASVRLPARSLGVVLAAVIVVVTVVVTTIPAVVVHAQDERVTVRIDGRALFRVGPTPEQTADDRARQIERRLNTLLENPDAIAPAKIEPAGDGSDAQLIIVAGVPVVTVSQADADDNLTTVDALAVQWRSTVDHALARAADRRLSPWGRFSAETLGAVETAFRRLGESTLRIIPRAVAALLVVGLFWVLAVGVRWLMRAIFRRIGADLTVQNLIKQETYYAVWILGIIVAIDALGIDPQTAATGLGLTSLALGFALQDILSNFVSGILILTLRPFEIGDQIVVGETEGSVERIDLRATHIRTYDGRLILVPNAELFTSRVTNNTASPVRRGSVELWLGYDVDVDQVVDVLQASTRSTPGVLASPVPSVRVRDLGAGGIRIEARYWAGSRRSDFLATTSGVRRGACETFTTMSPRLPSSEWPVGWPKNPDRTGLRLSRLPLGSCEPNA